MLTKEFNPKEPMDTFENVLFTNIVIKELRLTSLIELAPALMIIAHQSDLELFFTDSGMLCANLKHYKKACSILENSVMYN